MVRGGGGREGMKSSVPSACKTELINRQSALIETAAFSGERLGILSLSLSEELLFAALVWMRALWLLRFRVTLDCSRVSRNSRCFQYFPNFLVLRLPSFANIYTLVCRIWWPSCAARVAESRPGNYSCPETAHMFYSKWVSQAMQTGAGMYLRALGSQHGLPCSKD